MAKKRVVTPWGESWLDDTPTPAPVQKFTPIDVQTKAQDAIAPKYTQNLLNTQEQAAQKTPAPVAQQPQQTTPVVSPVSQQETQPSTMAQNTIPTAWQDKVSNGVSNAQIQGGQGSSIRKQQFKVGGTDNPDQIPYYNANTQQTVIPQPTEQGFSQAQQSILGTTTAPISDNFYDPSNFMYTGMSKQQYDSLDENGKIQALQTGENFLKQRQGVQGQAEKFAEYTRQKEYLTQQNEIKGQMTGLQEQNAKIQSEQQLRSSQQALNNLEQNLNFIGSGGKPAVFKQAMEAMKFQMFDAQRLHSELVTMQENGQKLRDLGIEFDENQFNKQMQDMEMAMNDQVDRSIQQALQGFNAQMMLGEVDTPAKLNALTNKWLDSIDMDVTNITNRQMGMITNMINQYKTLADEAKTRLAEDAKKKEQAQNVNEAMSKVRGYYVDGNGQIIVGNDGKPVYLPEKAPMEPVFKDGYLITFSTDANGQIVAKPQKVMEQSDMDKINLALKMEELKGKQLENAVAQGVDITGLGGATGDLRYLADQFPGQARAKNNNPAGITWNANFDNPKPGTTAYALQQAGVNFQKGTARPASEGGNYVTFPTIEDGLKAQQIMMTQTYGNKTVDQMLRSWVGTGEGPRYAQQVAGMAGVPLNVKVSQLTPEQLSTLQSAKIQKESPGLAKLLKQPAGQDINKLKMQVAGLTQGLGGTEGERTELKNNIVNLAQQKGISLQEAKKELGYKTGDDVEFAKARKEQIQAITKNNETISNAKRALALLDSPQTAVGDVATVVGFLKTIDPSSVARETEVESVESARGKIDSIGNTLSKLQTGQKLTSKQREELKQTIGIIVKAYENNLTETISSTKQEFDQRGLDPSVYINKNLIQKYGMQKEATELLQSIFGQDKPQPKTTQFNGMTPEQILQQYVK